MNKILHGDCLELMMDIKPKSIDMICCDLPYGTTQNKWDIIIPLNRLWVAYERIIKDNGAIVLTCSQPFTSMLVMSNPSMFKYSLVWNKKIVTGFLNSKKQPLRQHEDILVFYKKQPVYNPQMHQNKLRRNFEGSEIKPSTENYGKQRNYISKIKEDISFPRSIIEQTGVVNNSAEKTAHPTQKPIALIEYLIKTYTNAGQTVLDNCAGSGTTAIACINTNRKYICMEKNDEYFGIINERITRKG
ncbi:MAG: site-specific DNA-methyltransferase [Candidatus Babeliales bacterium]|nr:site-specific DNA-methyltransferase [Candidatus Babeliales bacterium]